MATVDVNSFFLLFNGVVAFLTQVGFALLECGLLRSKNAASVLIQRLVDVSIVAFVFWVFGFAFARGDATRSNAFIGYWSFAGDDIDGRFAEWFFQFLQAATATTIVSGAIAERATLATHVIFDLFFAGFVYPVIAHWAWTPQGFLFDGGYRDFAGSGVVHLSGGVAGLVGAAILGPRLGRFNDPAGPVRVGGHSVPLAVLGGFLLIVGHFGLKAGCHLNFGIAPPGDAFARAVVNTLLAVIASIATAVSINRIISLFRPDLKLSVVLLLKAALAGVAAIACGCDKLHTWAALLVGVVACPVALGVSRLIVACKVDDPLDAFAINAGAGAWGLLITPFFWGEYGLIYGAPRKVLPKAEFMLGYHLAGLLVIPLWAGALTALVFGVLFALKRLRVDENAETVGLDMTRFGRSAYGDPGTSIGGGVAGGGRGNGVGVAGEKPGAIPNGGRDQESHVVTVGLGQNPAWSK